MLTDKFVADCISDRAISNHATFLNDNNTKFADSSILPQENN